MESGLLSEASVYIMIFDYSKKKGPNGPFFLFA